MKMSRWHLEISGDDIEEKDQGKRLDNHILWVEVGANKKGEIN